MRLSKFVIYWICWFKSSSNTCQKIWPNSEVNTIVLASKCLVPAEGLNAFPTTCSVMFIHLQHIGSILYSYFVCLSSGTMHSMHTLSRLCSGFGRGRGEGVPGSTLWQTASGPITQSTTQKDKTWVERRQKQL